jgi:hypothetical protein
MILQVWLWVLIYQVIMPTYTNADKSNDCRYTDPASPKSAGIYNTTQSMLP